MEWKGTYEMVEWVRVKDVRGNDAFDKCDILIFFFFTFLKLVVFLYARGTGQPRCITPLLYI